MKTKGSVDTVRHRKTRSDKGKKRKLYAGKKTHPRRKINGSYRTYKSKRKRDDPISVEFWLVRRTSHQGYMNFSKQTRRHMHNFVYGGKQKVCIRVEPSLISTKEKISELACEQLWEGEWLLMLRSHSKNTHHNSPKAFARLFITDPPEGLKCRVIPNYTSRRKRRSLRRLFFWRDE